MKKICTLINLLTFASIGLLLTGCNAIHYAAASGDLVKVRAMLQSDPAAIDSTDGDHRTPLHYAAENGRLEMVQFLLDSGAKVNAVTKENDTALYDVCINACTNEDAIVKILLQHGADVNISRNGNWTPLYAVCRHDPLSKALEDDVENLKQEIKNAEEAQEAQYRANQEAQNAYYQSLGANAVASVYHTRSAANWAATKNADYMSALSSAGSYQNPIDIAQGKQLLSKKEQVLKQTKVHNENLLRMLLEAGANPNVTNCLKETTLMVARKYGNDAMVQLLIDKDAQ